MINVVPPTLKMKQINLTGSSPVKRKTTLAKALAGAVPAAKADATMEMAKVTVTEMEMEMEMIRGTNPTVQQAARSTLSVVQQLKISMSQPQTPPIKLLTEAVVTKTRQHQIIAQTVAIQEVIQRVVGMTPDTIRQQTRTSGIATTLRTTNKIVKTKELTSPQMKINQHSRLPEKRSLLEITGTDINQTPTPPALRAAAPAKL